MLVFFLYIYNVKKVNLFYSIFLKKEKNINDTTIHKFTIGRYN